MPSKKKGYKKKGSMTKQNPKYVVKWRDKDSKSVGTWEIADVPLKNQKQAKERFLFEIKDQYGLNKKDIEIINIKRKR